MDIVINSLYKNKEIFLRELISNASDALDKIRFKSIGDASILENQPKLEVRISFDKEARTVTIADTGIGMTKNDLIENLGTVAKSGTTNFMEALGGEGGGEDLSMIGQFGVGFYSIYLVSDKVTVASKSNDDEKQHVWTSTADGSFAVAEDPRGNTLGRGTEITMYLKDDSSEFLDDHRLNSLVKRYSEFITFPIYIRSEVSEIVDDVPEEEEVEDDEEEEDDDEIEVEDDEEEEEEAEEKGAKKKEIFRWEWVKANDSVAIWAREKEEVTSEEYKDFYRGISKDGTTTNSWIHFKAEGEVEFRGILFIPDEAQHDQYDKYYEKDAKIRLYVRKVLITDEFEELVPKYLNFMRGVVDSDDLPLNVNRESLQQSKILKVMGKKLVRKGLEMLRKMANEDAGKGEEDDDSKGADDEEEKEGVLDKNGKPVKSRYIKFWEEFGKSLKLGVIEVRTKGRCRGCV